MKKLIEYIKHGEKNSFVFGFFYDVEENDLIEIKIRAENEAEAWNKLNIILSKSATTNRTIYLKNDYKRIEKGIESNVKHKPTTKNKRNKTGGGRTETS